MLMEIYVKGTDFRVDGFSGGAEPRLCREERRQEEQQEFHRGTVGTIVVRAGVKRFSAGCQYQSCLGLLDLNGGN
jgi:hypothetical protein